MTKPIVMKLPCKLLSVNSTPTKNREGKDVVYYSCSIFCPDNGFCGTLNLSDENVYSFLETSVGDDVVLICNYNIDYKNLKVVNIEF